MGIVISVVASVLLYELYAWLPRIANRLLEWAVSTLPLGDQPRYREEWRAHLNELPNTAARLWHAINFCIAAHKINVDIIAEHRKVEASLRKLRFKLHETTGKVSELKLLIAKGRLQAQDLVTLVSSDWPAPASLLDEAARLAFENSRTVFKEFGHTLAKSIDVLWTLSETRAEKIGSTVARARDLLTSAAHELAELDRHRSCTEPSEQALERITGKLTEIDSILNRDDGDDAEDRESARRRNAIITAIEQANRALRPHQKS